MQVRLLVSVGLLASVLCVGSCKGEKAGTPPGAGDPFRAGDSSAGGDSHGGDLGPGDTGAGDPGDGLPSDPGPARPNTFEVTPAGGTMSGGGYTIQFQLGHPVGQGKASGGGMTLEGGAAVKP